MSSRKKKRVLYLFLNFSFVKLRPLSFFKFAFPVDLYAGFDVKCILRYENP